MHSSFVLDGVRTPFGRHGKAMAKIRPDDLAAHVVRELIDRAPDLDPSRIDDVIFGDANAAGEDNRDVARMAALLAGLPTTVPGTTVNRLCGSSLESVIQASRAVQTGDASIVIAGGVESMSRAPWVMLKPERSYDSGHATVHSTALLIGREDAVNGEPLARIAARAAVGNDPDVFGIAPVRAAELALERAGRTWADVDIVELNEAFAAQSLACLRLWPELDPDRVNIHGGAIAIGHPLGASGARIVLTAAKELQRRGGGVAVVAICIGVGQGLALVLER